MSRAATEYRYQKLTWPEINEAVQMEKICILPCGAVEQHGDHLPLDVDLMCPGSIAEGCGQALPEKVLVLPIVAYGYTGHVMDFPGTINTHYETFIKQVLVGQCTRRYDPNNLSLHRTFAFACNTNLLANGDRLTLSKQAGQVLVNTVNRYASHGNGPAC